MSKRLSHRPKLELLESRIAMSAAPVPGDLGGQVNPVLQAYSDAYLSVRGRPRYNAAVDSNHNGFVGQGDARALLRTVAAITPRLPLKVVVNLVPGEQVSGGHPKNSGGVTRFHKVTIVGRTTPNAIVFLDNPVGALATPAAIKRAGRYKFDVPDQLTQTEYLTFDPHGNQKIVAFPILRLGD
jgi:hypothetical protein